MFNETIKVIKKEMTTHMIIDSIMNIIASQHISTEVDNVVVDGAIKATLLKDAQEAFEHFLDTLEDKKTKKFKKLYDDAVAKKQDAHIAAVIRSVVASVYFDTIANLMMVLHAVRLKSLEIDTDDLTLEFHDVDHGGHDHTWCMVNIHLVRDRNDPNSDKLDVSYPFYFPQGNHALPDKLKVFAVEGEGDEQGVQTKNVTPEMVSKLEEAELLKDITKDADSKSTKDDSTPNTIKKHKLHVQ